jgi:ATP-binding cassette subfamily B protein RaxB
MVANHYGHRLDIGAPHERFSTSLEGATLADLMRMADALGFSTRALRLELDELKNLQAPAILHWNLNHFVVYAGMRRGKAVILDPASGEKRMALAEVSKHFTGVALELTPTAEFKPVEAVRRPKLSDFWSRMRGLLPALAQILILSTLLQLVALASPFYLKLVVDEAVVRFDESLLVLLALSFAGVYAIGAATEGLRSYVILALGQSMSAQLAGNVVRHLLRLPADYFEKRHVGDVISRVNAVQPIQSALTTSVVAALIDGVMAIATAALMLYFAPQLALIVFIAAALYALITLAVFPFRRERTNDLITARAKENSTIIESIRAARAVKLFARESIRETTWRNAFAEVVNAGVASGRLEIGVALANALLFGLSLVAVVFVGAKSVLAGNLTIGMLFAFLAYRQNFSDRIAGLIGKAVEFRMLNLHLERLADIVHTPQEEGLGAPAFDGAFGTRGSAPPQPPLDSEGGSPRGDMGDHQGERRGLAIELVNASFRYSPNDPFIFENLSIAIAAGDFIAISGPSGGGKTTLMKVLLGLLPPTQGELKIEGAPLRSYGLARWRELTGVVMQDDQLLSGTIADNISFFDPEIDSARVEEAARQARIHDDIVRMPMKYLSLVGDMGSALSGGQRQRLLLARALYRRPLALFLDEGTANLDETTEREIGDLIAALPVTRIVVAHRPELIRRARRRLVMAGGRLTESAPSETKAPALALA